MGQLQRLAGMYMAAVATVVGAYMVISAWLISSVDVVDVWAVLDYFMAVGFVLALIFGYLSLRRAMAARESGRGDSGYGEAAVGFFLTAFVSLLFFQAWFHFLVDEELEVVAPLAWVVIDAAAAVLLGYMGCKTAREAGG